MIDHLDQDELKQCRNQLRWMQKYSKSEQAEMNVSPDQFLIRALKALCPEGQQSLVEEIIAEYENAIR